MRIFRLTTDKKKVKNINKTTENFRSHSRNECNKKIIQSNDILDATIVIAMK